MISGPYALPTGGRNDSQAAKYWLLLAQPTEPNHFNSSKGNNKESYNRLASRKGF